MPVDIPGIDISPLSKDQYDISLQVSQQVYDGGAVASAKRMANAQSDVERERVNVAMYDVYERIDQLFSAFCSLMNRYGRYVFCKTTCRLLIHR